MNGASICMSLKIRCFSNIYSGYQANSATVLRLNRCWSVRKAPISPSKPRPENATRVVTLPELVDAGGRDEVRSRVGDWEVLQMLFLKSAQMGTALGVLEGKTTDVQAFNTAISPTCPEAELLDLVAHPSALQKHTPLDE